MSAADSAAERLATEPGRVTLSAAAAPCWPSWVRPGPPDAWAVRVADLADRRAVAVGRRLASSRRDGIASSVDHAGGRGGVCHD